MASSRASATRSGCSGSPPLLTGADLDIESLARDARGNLWLGDEFGPYLVRTDRTGKVLQAPIPLPDGTRSPQSPDLLPGETPNLPASKGFEAVAVSRDGWTLYPILEGARTTDPDQRRRIPGRPDDTEIITITVPGLR